MPAVGVGRLGVPGGWNTRASAIFDSGALDPLDYAPSDAAPLDGAVVAIGRALFFDACLSRNGQRACATCHQPGRAFADGRALPAVDPGAGRLRNTPTLINAGLQPFQFADARVRSLEDQVAAVLENPREMNLPLVAATARLASDTGLVRRFALTYGEGQRPAPGVGARGDRRARESGERQCPTRPRPRSGRLRSRRDPPSCVQDAVAPKRRPDRAVHAQRRVPNAQSGGGVL